MLSCRSSTYKEASVHPNRNAKHPTHENTSRAACTRRYPRTTAIARKSLRTSSHRPRDDVHFPSSTSGRSHRPVRVVVSVSQRYVLSRPSRRVLPMTRPVLPEPPARPLAGLRYHLLNRRRRRRRTMVHRWYVVRSHRVAYTAVECTILHSVENVRVCDSSHCEVIFLSRITKFYICL